MDRSGILRVLLMERFALNVVDVWHFIVKVIDFWWKRMWGPNDEISGKII